VRQQQDLRTAVAAPQASALLLAALPLLALAMGSGIGADPWHVLAATPVGNLLLIVGVGLEAAGLAWSSRLVQRALP
jgi:tight adherence protein B